MKAPDVLLDKLKAANVKPVVLAKALNVSEAMASMILTGKRGISTWHLDAVAALLGVDVPQLFMRQSTQKGAYSTTPAGGAHDSSDASTSPSALRRHLRERDQFIARTEAATRRLLALFATRDETPTLDVDAPQQRTSHRRPRG